MSGDSETEAELAGMAHSDRPATQRDVYLMFKALRRRQDIIEDQDRESHGWTAFLVVACTFILVAAIAYSDKLHTLVQSITAGAQ